MASKWKSLDKALELQQAHTREKQEALRLRARAMREEGLSFKLIAERLGVGVDAAKTLCRGRPEKKRHARAPRLLTQTSPSGTKLDGTEQ